MKSDKITISLDRSVAREVLHAHEMGKLPLAPALVTELRRELNPLR
jgi:hypothetical protein